MHNAQCTMHNAVFQRVGFMVTRLLVLAPPEEVAGLYGASMGEERGAALLSSKASVIGAAAAKAADKLTRDDALSYAAAWAFNPTIYVRGWSAPWSAAESDGDPVKHAAMHSICDPFSKCVGTIWCSLLPPILTELLYVCSLAEDADACCAAAAGGICLRTRLSTSSS
eukprot:COSAG06_NODE_28635_length_570_cov_7.484076_1_plen_167_part_01